CQIKHTSSSLSFYTMNRSKLVSAISKPDTTAAPTTAIKIVVQVECHNSFGVGFDNIRYSCLNRFMISPLFCAKMRMHFAVPKTSYFSHTDWQYALPETTFSSQQSPIP